MSDSKRKRGASAPLLNSKLKVTIEKLAVGGSGIARHEGVVLFIPDSAPGDELIAEITLVKKNFCEARIREIIQPGPSRRKPPCPVADRCGGCNWQHIETSEQLRQKEMIVRENIKKFLPDQNPEFLPIVASPRDFRYRNRIQPKIKNSRFGFYARDSHDIVEISDCPITEEPLAQKFPEAKAWALAQGKEGRLEMSLSTSGEVRYGFANEPEETMGFSQVNRFQNEDLLRTALAWSQGFFYNHVYDLYAGAGNFSFPLFDSHQRPLTAVELSPQLVSRGTQHMGSRQIKFVHSDVEKYLVQKAKIGSSDLVILDPPRAGCSEVVMQKLAHAEPQKIIYISCHPVSLARDLKWFFATSEKLGKKKLRLRRVQAFEMFPQTDHVETIAELGVDS